MAKSHLDIKDLTMNKPYLSISEVAAKFDVSADLLRKWEKDFPQYLHPKRTGSDSRLYDKKALQQVAAIYRLIRVEGLSIDGAKRKLRSKGQDQDVARQDVIQRLQALRQQLLGIVEELDKSVAPAVAESTIKDAAIHSAAQ